MDKPISENLAEVKKLQKLARQKNVLFVVAFNRRFAPQTAKLKALTEKKYGESKQKFSEFCE